MSVTRVTGVTGSLTLDGLINNTGITADSINTDHPTRQSQHLLAEYI